MTFVVDGHKIPVVIGANLLASEAVSTQYEPYAVFAKDRGPHFVSTSTTQVLCHAQVRAGTALRLVTLHGGRTVDDLLETTFGTDPVHARHELLQIRLMTSKTPFDYEVLVDFPGRIYDHRPRWLKAHHPIDWEERDVLDNIKLAGGSALNLNLNGARLLNFRAHGKPLIRMRIAEFSAWRTMAFYVASGVGKGKGEDIATRVVRDLSSERCSFGWLSAIEMK